MMFGKEPPVMVTGMVTMASTFLSAEDIVRSEMKDSSIGLGSVKWYRAVLDEAHVIKGYKQAGRTFLTNFLGTSL